MGLILSWHPAAFIWGEKINLASGLHKQTPALVNDYGSVSFGIGMKYENSRAGEGIIKFLPCQRYKNMGMSTSGGEGPAHKLNMSSCLAQKSIQGCFRSDLLVCVHLVMTKTAVSLLWQNYAIAVITSKGHRINMAGKKIIIWKWNCSFCFSLPGRDWCCRDINFLMGNSLMQYHAFITSVNIKYLE